MLILLWLALFAQSFGLAWVSTEGVHVRAGFILKGAPVRPGELAVFLYRGGSIPDYYPSSSFSLPGWLADLVGVRTDAASRAGPKRDTGFVKYLWGVPGDRIEVVGDEVFLTNARGRWAMGKVKPRARSGAALAPIAPQTIPAGYAYMWAPHPDALDSRYLLMGLVPLSSVAGRAVPLW